MSKKIKDTEYLYLSSMVAARSSRLLTRDKMERMLDAPSFSESAKMLTESGYEDMSDMNAGQVETALAEHRSEIMTELAKFSPEPELVDIFRLKYDYHNVKVAIKSDAVGVKANYLYSGAGRVAPERIAEACTTEEPVNLPKRLAEAIEEATAILARTANPQTADIYLDQACYSEMLDIAERTQSSFLKGYVRFLIDSVNLKTSVRIMRMGEQQDLLRGTLIRGGNIDTDVMASAAANGDFAGMFVATPLADAAGLASAAATGGVLTEFELQCDNAELKYLRAAGMTSFGEEPVVIYIASVESEIAAIRMILTGILAGVSPDSIRERLRDNNA